MAHRHPSKLNAEYVEHPRARSLLKAELANCAECRDASNEEVLDDMERGGIFESLLRGFVAKQSERWRTTTTTYPVILHELVPPDEAKHWATPTREVVRMCVIKSRRGKISTSDALTEARLLDVDDRSRVLDDLVDGLLDDEG
ncbi:hypothetical protein F4561_002742 [Lipingzhangella halophila]|uniref:Uncharacterized protein n=1 Tax=Lipingzhangella halophila TaxID=1783352 RepID=A0A7W7RH70_9ACTN|nr:hypothetical protein [Lipingzhangella halophila]MBB4931922.1 hypothetical protein [Lipingzhangella halophila]